MSLLVREVLPEDAPMDLLLLADPSVDKVLSYLPRSRCFVATAAPGGDVVGVAVVQPMEEGAHELMAIAVRPAWQKSGHGSQLLASLLQRYRAEGARRMEVGTGTFGYQLAFYQHQGFRVTGIDRDFFLRNYPEPVFEDGIQLFDMLRLSLRFADRPGTRVDTADGPAAS